MKAETRLISRRPVLLADVCRECGGDSRVIRTRRPLCSPIRRRRECVHCEHRWTTVESHAQHETT